MIKARENSKKINYRYAPEIDASAMTKIHYPYDSSEIPISTNETDLETNSLELTSSSKDK